MIARPLLTFLLIFFLGIGGARAEGLIITLHIEQQEKDGKAEGTIAQKDYTVRLFPQTVDVRTGDIEEVYDFANRRYYSADLAKKTLQSYSLCAIPIANRLEKDRRLKVTFDQLRQKNPSLAFDDVKDVDIDILFGSQGDTKTSDEIKTSLSNDSTLFFVGDRQIANMAMSDVAVPDALKAAYAHFFVYSMGLHPVVDSAVAGTGKVLKKLQFVNQDGANMSQFTVTMVSAVKTPDDGPSLSGLSQIYTGDPNLDAAIRTSVDHPGSSRKDMEAKISGFLGQKDFLRAALAAKEMNLTLEGTGAETSDVGKQALGSNDAAARALLDATTAPHSTQEFIGHMEQLNKAKEHAPDYSYLIEMLRADVIKTVFGNRTQPTPDEAKAMSSAFDKLRAAIIANPWLTAAYCDLGDAYFNARQPRAAWAMWEQAARLNPRYPGLQHAAMFEEHSLKDFPEYF